MVPQSPKSQFACDHVGADVLKSSSRLSTLIAKDEGCCEGSGQLLMAASMATFRLTPRQCTVLCDYVLACYQTIAKFNEQHQLGLWLYMLQLAGQWTTCDCRMSVVTHPAARTADCGAGGWAQVTPHSHQNCALPLPHKERRRVYAQDEAWQRSRQLQSPRVLLCHQWLSKLHLHTCGAPRAQVLSECVGGVGAGRGEEGPAGTTTASAAGEAVRISAARCTCMAMGLCSFPWYWWLENAG